MEEPSQLRPASSWLGRPNPLGQWLLLRALGGAEKQGCRGCGGPGPKGTSEASFLEIKCQERVQTILQRSPGFRESWCRHFFQGRLHPWQEAQLTERRVGWGGRAGKPVTMGQRKKQPRSGPECPGGREGGTSVVWACQRRAKTRSCSLGPRTPGKLGRQGTEGAGLKSHSPFGWQQEGQRAGWVP